MKKKVLSIVAAVLAMTMLSSAMQREASQQTAERIQKEVRHEILILPFYDVFDNITFKVEGYNVTLSGQVTRPTLKNEMQSS